MIFLISDQSEIHDYRILGHAGDWVIATILLVFVTDRRTDRRKIIEGEIADILKHKTVLLLV